MHHRFFNINMFNVFRSGVFLVKEKDLKSTKVRAEQYREETSCEDSGVTCLRCVRGFASMRSGSRNEF